MFTVLLGQTMEWGLITTAGQRRLCIAPTALSRHPHLHDTSPYAEDKPFDLRYLSEVNPTNP